jgi:hypothetical protein
MLHFMFPHCWIHKKIKQIPSLNRCPATFSTSNFISASTSARARPWTWGAEFLLKGQFIVPQNRWIRTGLSWPQI